MALLWKYFALGFSALLPVVNPLGSSLVFLGLVGVVPAKVYRSLARRIAINTILFFAVIELVGSAILSFFGISLPIVQLAGGFVLAAMGWSLLNEKDPQTTADQAQAEVESNQRSEDSLAQGAFYPLTFPVTAGPGCIVVMLTLSAHASKRTLSDGILSHCGLLLAVILLSILVYVFYAYAPQITRAISPSTAHGILRVVAFILLCIGVQIAWNGAKALILPLLQHH
ncbi:MAG TPA: MarC family protein [Edaphobacter sp.]|nr:MarC family protein [Edaphobacter sp.]